MNLQYTGRLDLTSSSRHHANLTHPHTWLKWRQASPRCAKRRDGISAKGTNGNLKWENGSEIVRVRENSRSRSSKLAATITAPAARLQLFDRPTLLALSLSVFASRLYNGAALSPAPTTHDHPVTEGSPMEPRFHSTKFRAVGAVLCHTIFVLSSSVLKLRLK